MFGMRTFSFDLSKAEGGSGTEFGDKPGSVSVHSDAHTCTRCGWLVWTGQIHACNVPQNPPPSRSTPHRCPVCNGTTIVPAGFYDSGFTSAHEPCRACVNGIVWSD